MCCVPVLLLLLLPAIYATLLVDSKDQDDPLLRIPPPSLSPPILTPFFPTPHFFLCILLAHFFCFLLSVFSSSHMMYCYVSHFCKLSVFVSVPQSSFATVQSYVLQCRAKAQSYSNKQFVRFGQIL